MAASRRLARLLQQLCDGQAVGGIKKLLVANRGEIAIRIFRAARELGIATVSIHTPEDAGSLHASCADESLLLEQPGAAARDTPSSLYLDAEAVLAAASRAGADAIHPGYGFLSEDASFVEACEARGFKFVGPFPETVALFGDKTEARRFAVANGVPVLRGADTPCSSAAEVRSCMAELGIKLPIMVKAVAGGGGRGLREVHSDAELEEAVARCTSEAVAACGHGGVFFEELLLQARHVEVQILGDGNECVHLFERDCSAQVRRQKVVEMAPARYLKEELRSQLHNYALRLATACKYRSAGTFEFLLSDEKCAFIEGNPRIQVEHTVTEEAVGVDLVQAQLLLASGRSLADLGLQQQHIHMRCYAIQARVNMLEAGSMAAYQEPSGPGVRVDSGCFAGYQPSVLYDPLLAKVIVSGPLRSTPLSDDEGFEMVRKRLVRALREFHIGGTLCTNLEQLVTLIDSRDFAEHRITTSFLDSSTSVNHGARRSQKLAREELLDSSFAAASASRPTSRQGAAPVPQLGHEWLLAPLAAQLVSADVEAGMAVRKGQSVAVLLSMKMEHVVKATSSGVVREVKAQVGDRLEAGAPIFLIQVGQPSIDEEAHVSDTASRNLSTIRKDLAEVLERRCLTTDTGRLEHDSNFRRKLLERHEQGQRSARENVADLVDSDSFVEVGRLLIAQQRKRRTLDDLIKHTPADGVVSGIGTVNAHIFGETRARTAVVAYDYTVLAGTQGLANHRKQDRMVELALQQEIPMIWFCEGGGGRPGDTDAGGMAGAGLATPLWAALCKLSGLVPLIGLTTGRCFAGNAAILGCCDVVIATEGSNIGMGGPAMIEGGGLGSVRPEEIGPVDVQKRNGVVDVVVKDEAEAVSVAKQYLSYFQGALPQEMVCEAADQRLLRQLVPENRLRVYEMRPIVETILDGSSFLELRRHYGPGMITGLGRIAGRPLGVVANDPMHLGGAIDSDAALKASRFMKLCDAFGLPILFLCDTPGFMVGVQSEEDAAVRKVCSMFLTGASLSVPFFTIVTRKAYGLGGQAMGGGAFMGRNTFSVSWPTGEFGGMGLEGAVRLGFRKELDAAGKESESARKQLFDKILAELYEHGKALNDAMMLELDDVIDPAESRHLILAALRQLPLRDSARWQRRRPCVDSW